jgi:hypothetical protein
MDILKQTKLSKSEWDSLEVPFPEKEKEILYLIKEGYGDTKIIHNHSPTMIAFTKLSPAPEMQYYIYNKYFLPLIDPLRRKYNITNTSNGMKIKKLKSGDTIRIENADRLIQDKITSIYEFMCIGLCKKILKTIHHNEPCCIELFTLTEWCGAKIHNSNRFVMDFVSQVIAVAQEKTTKPEMILAAPAMIEKNKELYLYANISLHPHQKDIFSFCKREKTKPKLVLYTAPTGTGKTLTPIGLSEGYKIIFVCVARHIGLALAKSAISIDRKIAFAFGCETASDIRLHYFSAIDYQKNKRSGGIGKVDNSNGSAVEIMICDVQSYLVAMYYMMSFNEANTILTYWDEPTMTLDYETHPLHQTIHENWYHNKIPNMVLSCATLPNEEQLQGCIHDFRMTFLDAEVHTITSYDCKKSIPIIATNGHCFMPHIHCNSLSQVQEYGRYCERNKTLLRYFDLQEIIYFIMCLHETMEDENPLHLNNYFDTVEDIHMNGLKVYYLHLLMSLNETDWNRVHSTLVLSQKKKFEPPAINDTHRKGALYNNPHSFQRMQSISVFDNNTKMGQDEITRANSEPIPTDNTRDPMSGVLLTTKDAHTLTDGPTIYLADNLINLARFYVHKSEIPGFILQRLLDQIQRNDDNRKVIEDLETKLEIKLQVKDNRDIGNSNSKKSGPKHHEKSGLDENTQVLKDNIQELKKELVHLTMDPEYIPNTEEHQQKWYSANKGKNKAFKANIDETTVKEVMVLEIDPLYKFLVLMGIGILIENVNTQYEEIVKKLAQEQKLYLILTSSDFIYGTNYQFCHGFIGKDLQDMTPQKVLQSMGRIGRNSSQQDYSVRFRNDEMIHMLFSEPDFNREAYNMNTLLCH